MKWFGILLLQAAFGLWGLYRAQQLRQRAADLRELCAAFSLLREEIGWRQAEYTAILAAHGEQPFFVRWARAGGTVGQGCMQAAGELALSPADKALLREFATQAGKTDRAGQLALLERTCTRLEEQAKEAKEESKSQGRVQLAVALCLGGVAGLLLL